MNETDRLSAVLLWKDCRNLAIQVSDSFYTRKVTRTAAALSFTTLLALVPLATVMLSALSVFPVFSHWGEDLQSFIYSHFVPAAGDVIRSNIEQFSLQAARLTSLGLMLLLLSALFLLSTIEGVFNDLWQVKRGRQLLQRLLLYWALLTLGPLLMGAALSLTSSLVSGNIFHSFGPLATITSSVGPFVLEWAAFLLMYTAIPNCPVPFRSAAYGAILAAALFQIAKFGFGWFVTHFASYEIIYGALASLPVFLLWLYLSWLVVLVGVILSVILTPMQSPSSVTLSASQ